MATQQYNTDILLTIDIDQAKKDLQAINDQIKTLNATTDDTEEQVKALEKQWDLLDATIKKVEGTTKEYSKDTEEAKKESEKLGETTKKVGGIFSESINAYNKAGGGIKGVTAAAKAFIATPLGAAITAITGALAIFKKALSGSERGQKALAKATAVVKGVFDSLLQVVRDTGTLLVDFFTGNWTKLGEDINNIGAAVKGIGTNMKENAQIAERENELRRREKDLEVEISARQEKINELRRIAMDQSKTAAEREAARQKMQDLELKNIDDQIKLEQDRLKLLKDKHALTDSTIEDIEEEKDVQITINNLNAQRQEILIKSDKLQDRISKAVEKQKDDTEEIVDYTKQIEALAKSTATDLANAELKLLEISAKSIEAEGSPEEKLAARMAVLDKEKEIAIKAEEDKYKAMLAEAEKYGTSADEIEKLHAANKKAIDQQYALDKINLEKEKDDEILKLQEKTNSELSKLDKERAKDEEERLQGKIKSVQAIADLTTTILDVVADSQEANSEDSFEKQKKTQIASATVSGLMGAAGAFAQGSASAPPPYGQIIGAASAAAVLATTAANIAKIKKQKYNAPSESSGSTGETSSASTAQIATGTSSISQAIIGRNISAAATETTPTVQTVLVVDDVTSKQMQQDRIQKVSTI